MFWDKKLHIQMREIGKRKRKEEKERGKRKRKNKEEKETPPPPFTVSLTVKIPFFLTTALTLYLIPYTLVINGQKGIFPIPKSLPGTRAVF